MTVHLQPAAVLMYHSVCAEPAQPKFAPYVVTPATLERQLSALAEDGFEIHSGASAYGNGNRTRSVALTFDDGYRDFYDVALPILDRLGMRASLFVPTGYLGSTARWLGPEGEDGRPILDASQVCDIARSGLVDVGAHSHSHPALDVVDAARRKSEIRLPRLILEDLLQSPVTAFAYPFGYFNGGARREVAAAGYEVAYAVGERHVTPGDNPLAIPRLSVSPDLSPAELLRLVRSGSQPGRKTVAGLKRHVWRQERRVTRQAVVPQAAVGSVPSGGWAVGATGRGRS
jgi:peptidoglycan/xylan/chitin deacetylase (PgdA/CDA1 family)